MRRADAYDMPLYPAFPLCPQIFICLGCQPPHAQDIAGRALVYLLLNQRKQAAPYPVTGIVVGAVGGILYPGAAIFLQPLHDIPPSYIQKGAYDPAPYIRNPFQPPEPAPAEQVVEYGFCLVVAVMGYRNPHPFIPARPGPSAEAPLPAIAVLPPTAAPFPPAGLLLQCLISQDPACLLLGHPIFRCGITHIYLYDMTGDIQFFTQFPDKIRIPVSLLSPESMVDMDR